MYIFVITSLNCVYKYKCMIGRIFMFMAIIGLSISHVSANNVRITDKVKVAGQLGKDTLLLSFPLSWENSWRLGENWDAVYLFFKYKRVGFEEPWHHMPVKAEGNNVGSGLSYTTVAGDSKVVGMLVYRTGNGSGNVNTMVRVKTDISQGDMVPYYRPTVDDFKSGKIEIAVGAIEMVFVPNGPYYLGDGASIKSFVDAGGAPIYMSSENEQTLYGLGDSEMKTLSLLYPKGYKGFYCMKYEISQEQYTYFLNKIPYEEQKKRIGNDLDRMSVGDYAFSTESKPPFRNGIILEKRRGAGNAVIFGHNLDKNDNVFNGAGDGQTIACNFMTPADLFVYADWVGLRPLSELEYEKACRPRNPQIKPTSYECAWNMRYDENKLATSLKYDGTVREVANDGANVNTMARFNAGPLRCGSFARPGNSSMEAAGASFWGIMDMTGNLSEICCNADKGCGFNGMVNGDGNMLSTPVYWIMTKVTFRDSLPKCGGHSWPQLVAGGCGLSESKKVVNNVFHKEYPYYDSFGRKIVVHMESKDTLYYNRAQYTDPNAPFAYFYTDIEVNLPYHAWVDSVGAYGTRGGSFATNDYRYIAISDRHSADYFSSSVQKRNEEVSFRLGVSVEAKNIRTGVIAMNNNLSLDTAVFSPEAPYTIKEIENSIDASESILYRWEVDSAGKWDVIEGEISKELVLSQIWNKTATYKTYQFRRKSQTVFGEGYSNVVTLVVPGFLPRLQPGEGVVDPCGGSTPVTAYFAVAIDSVRWLKEDGTVLAKTVGGTTSVYSPSRTQFPVAGKYKIKCEVYLNGAVQVVNGGVRVDAAFGSDFCPNTVADNGGNVYRAKIMPDCRCWMIDDLKYKTSTSELSPDGAVRMYNWFDDLINEYGEDSHRVSQICPEGWRLPTVGMASNLAKFNVLKSEFNALDRGAWNLWADTEISGNYWAVMYATNPGAGEDGHGEFIITPAFLSVDASGKLIFKKATLDDESNGQVYMTVRCVKMVNP